MSTAPDAVKQEILDTVAEVESVKQEILDTKAEVESVKQQLPATNVEEKLALQQQLAALQLQLAALKQQRTGLWERLTGLQEKLLLMQQQAAPAAAAPAAAAAAPAAAAAAAAVCVDVDLGRWAQELINLQGEDRCLHQPACQPVDLPPQLRHSLYIRHSYCKLFELVWDKCECGATGKQPGFIVTGTPGIGKSAFALYLVQQLGMRRQIVCYEYQDECSVYQRLKFDFRDIDSVVAKRIQLPASDDDLQLSLSWRILEGPPPKLEFSGKTKTVVLSSPNHNLFTTWLKGRYACDPLYMPTWSLEELQACRKRLYPNVAADIAAERYAWLGGSIRHVLVKTETDPRTLVLAAVHKQSAKELVYAINKAFTWRSDFCHTLGHFQVKPNFSVRYVTFASPRASDQVLEQLAAEQKQKLQRFLVGSQDLADLGSLRGVLFERHGHKVFQLGGIACKWRQLQQPTRKRERASSPSAEDDDEQQQEGEDEEESHHFATVLLQPEQEVVQQQFQHLALTSSTEYKVPSDLKQLWDDCKQELAHLSCNSNAYIMPRKSNNAAWDAVVLGGPAPLILQFTISRSHGIKARLVDVLLQRLSPDVRNTARLVFVVPPEVFDTFPWQPWQTVKGKEMQNVPTAVKKLQQWVMQLGLQPGPRAGSSSGDAGSSGHSSRGDSGGGAVF